MNADESRNLLFLKYNLASFYLDDMLYVGAGNVYRVTFDLLTKVRNQSMSLCDWQQAHGGYKLE